MKKFDVMKHYFFVLLVTIGFLASCSSSKTQLTRVKAINIPITDTISQKAEIEKFITPYREHISSEMSTVLAQNPADLVKDRKEKALNTAIGNFMADATFEIVNPLYKKRTGKDIDFVMLNWGGIRSDLPKGDVTVGSVYDIMPVENKVVVLTMSGEKVQELLNYLIKERKPHPLSKQIDLQITKDGKVVHFNINGKPFDSKATYIVATSDYLMNGGDAMYFFENSLKVDETDYKLRNVLIDYFKKIDVLDAKKDNRFEYKL